jgi:hypothetical protein
MVGAEEKMEVDPMSDRLDELVRETAAGGTGAARSEGEQYAHH